MCFFRYHKSQNNAYKPIILFLASSSTIQRQKGEKGAPGENGIGDTGQKGHKGSPGDVWEAGGK